MGKLLTNISLEVDTNHDGTYDIYLSTECSSGAHYENISAAKIGEYVADLVDTVEEANSGNSYLRDDKTVILSHTDGYSIQSRMYHDKKAAYAAMKTAYDQLNQNTPGDEWDELSHISSTDALLYDKGDNVYVWRITGVTT